METISGQEFAEQMHTREVSDNIELRKILADCSVGFDGTELIKMAREIAKSDERVAKWQKLASRRTF